MRARTRRYLESKSGCLRCNHGRSWASARTRYLQRCLRCSRCNRRRSSWSAPACWTSSASCVSNSLIGSVGAWCCRAGDGSRRAGRLSVPDDGRRCDRPDPRRAQALRWPKAPAAPAAALRAPGRHRSSWVAARDRPCRIVRLRPGAALSRPVRPAGPAFSGRTTRTRVSRAAMTRSRPPPAAAAKTCLRRRNARLPGIICKRLQITAVMHVLARQLASIRGRTDEADLGVSGRDWRAARRHARGMG